MDKKILEQDIWNYMSIVHKLNPYMMGHKGFVAGGAFKNLFNNEKVKDLDFFFYSKEDFIEADEKFKKDEEYYKFYENKKVKAYKNKHTKVVVELIRYRFGSPLEILNDFDFTITKCAFVNNYKTKEDMEKIFELIEPDEKLEDFLDDSKFLIHQDFFEHLHTKRLVIDEKLVKPVNTLERMFRYAKYGYSPCRETKVRIIKEMRELNQFSEELISMGLYDGLD